MDNTEIYQRLLLIIETLLNKHNIHYINLENEITELKRIAFAMTFE